MIRLAAALSLPSGDLAAQSVEQCHEFIDVTMITEPWEERSRSFANGAVRVFEAVGDPNLANSAVIGLLHPVPGELAGSGMFRGGTAILSDRDGRSFFGEVLIEATEANYDPATGLTLRIPVRYATDSRGLPVEDVVTVTVNQATGWVTAE